MQIEQNFRDEKSERFGFGLRASYSAQQKEYSAEFAGDAEYNRTVASGISR
ncbi:transposase [Escherichia coli]|nr:transposase [Escherichia coli]